MDPVRERFEQLVLPHQADLHFAAVALCRHEADAQDLVQEALLKAWRGFSSFNRGDNVKAWLFTILRNAHVDRCRQKRLEPLSLDPDEGAPTAAVPDPTPLPGFLEEDLLKALRELSPGHQILLILCDVQGFRYREIAEVLGCPIGSVMSGLHHARTRLKARILMGNRGASS